MWGPTKNTNFSSSSISKEDMRKLQVLQNKIMRIETGSAYDTPTKTLLKDCNYLSVHQLVAFHSGIQIPKTLTSKLPMYHIKRMENSTQSPESVWAENHIQIDFNLSLAKSSFFHQATRIWNLIPKEIKVLKSENSLNSSKNSLNSGFVKISQLGHNYF